MENGSLTATQVTRTISSYVITKKEYEIAFTVLGILFY